MIPSLEAPNRQSSCPSFHVWHGSCIVHGPDRPTSHFELNLRSKSPSKLLGFECSGTRVTRNGGCERNDWAWLSFLPNFQTILWNGFHGGTLRGLFQKMAPGMVSETGEKVSFLTEGGFGLDLEGKMVTKGMLNGFACIMWGFQALISDTSSGCVSKWDPNNPATCLKLTTISWVYFPCFT